MARKTPKAGPTLREASAVNPATGLPWRFRAPREMRVVSSRLANSARGRRERLPFIAIGGKWLEHLGFSPGARFLLLADTSNQLLLALLKVD